MSNAEQIVQMASCLDLEMKQLQPPVEDPLFHLVQSDITIQVIICIFPALSQLARTLEIKRFHLSNI